LPFLVFAFNFQCHIPGYRSIFFNNQFIFLNLSF